MKTEVTMIRQLFGSEIKQRSKSEMLGATDLVRAGNTWRMSNGIKSLFNLSQHLSLSSTKEFIEQIEREYGVAVVKSRGRNAQTWVHPLLFIDIALAINPRLKLEVYKWLYDNLLRYRNMSGDSYKKMTGVLWIKTSNKTDFTKNISKLAEIIRAECGVKDWQTATENQLKLRDKIHDNIALLADVMTNTKEAIRLAIIKAKEDIN
jgi:hypothetical protein